MDNVKKEFDPFDQLWSLFDNVLNLVCLCYRVRRFNLN